MNHIDSPAWRALAAHAEAIRPQHLRDLFAADSARFDTLSIRHDGLLFDFSKQRVTTETMALLRHLAQAADVDGWKQQLADWAEQIAELNQQQAGDTDTGGDPSCGPDGCGLPPR